MIIWNEKMKKTNDIFKGVDNELSKKKINVDGVVESFNDGKEQGMVLKLYDKYNPDIDLCIWAYLPNERDYNNQIKILIGKHSNCKKNNLWESDLSSNIIHDSKARIMHNLARDYIVDSIIDNINKTYDLKVKI